jgi:polyphenol oxidase
VGWPLSEFELPGTRLQMLGAAHLTVASAQVFVGHQSPHNLALHVGPQANVALNRERLAKQLGCEIQWLKQIHGTSVYDADSRPLTENGVQTSDPIADAAITQSKGVALAILTADCLPVMFSNLEGDCVAGAHAGWRGLLNGVLENTVTAFEARGFAASQVVAYIGPAIGREYFEVGAEVRAAFLNAAPSNDVLRVGAFFKPQLDQQKWLCDLVGLARMKMQDLGVHVMTSHATPVQDCTYANPAKYFSYRYFCHHPEAPQGDGRQATLIWLAA